MKLSGFSATNFHLFHSAGALQTIINLMSEKELHHWWTMSNGYAGNAKIQHLGIDWNVEAAKTVLNAWQRKFVRVRYFYY